MFSCQDKKEEEKTVGTIEITAKWLTLSRIEVEGTIKDFSDTFVEGDVQSAVTKPSTFIIKEKALSLIPVEGSFEFEEDAQHFTLSLDTSDDALDFSDKYKINMTATLLEYDLIAEALLQINGDEITDMMDITSDMVETVELFSLGGSASGLGTDKSLVLATGNHTHTVIGNGPFQFNNKLTQGTSYDVSVKTQPSAQSCTVTNGKGILDSDVSDLGVSCAPANSQVLKACEAGDPADMYSLYQWNPTGTAVTVECRFVTVAGNGIKDGSSWANAYSVSALRALGKGGANDISDASASKIYLYLVKAGTYTPLDSSPTSTERLESFRLRDYVGIIGGFSGIDYEVAGTTVFSGNNGNNSDKADNAFHVFNIDETHNTVVQNGATLIADSTVTEGNANNVTGNNIYGGGIYINNTSPTFSGITVSNNDAQSGAGIYCINSRFSLTRFTLSGNRATRGGGARFDSNCNATVIGGTITGNSAINQGGGISNDSSSSILIGVTIAGNSGERGGGLFSQEYLIGSFLINVIMWGNSATNCGNQICFGSITQPEKITLGNVILEGGTAGIGYNNTTPGQMKISKNNVTETDPQLATLANNGGILKTMAIPAGSPAVDAGLYVRKKTDGSFLYSADKLAWYATPILNTPDADNITAAPVNSSESDAATPVNIDSRGYKNFGNPDIGAFEFNGVAP